MALVDFDSFIEDGTNYTFLGDKLFRIIYDETTRKFRLFAKTPNLLESVVETFSVENKQAFFASRYGYKVDPKISFVNGMGLFQRGMIFDVLKYLGETYGGPKVVSISDCAKRLIQTELRPLDPKAAGLDPEEWIPLNISEESGVNTNNRAKHFPAFEYRPYQLEAVQKLIFDARGRGMIEVPTAGGKSFIIANFLFNVTKFFKEEKQLVVQMYRDFSSFGWDESDMTMLMKERCKIGNKVSEPYNPNASVIFANRQIIFKNRDMLPPVDILFVDECHTAKATATSDLIESLNCSVKVGCSATIPRKGEDYYRILGLLGPVVYKISITDLQGGGYISKLDINEIDIIDENVTKHDLFHLEPLRKYNPQKPGNIEFDEAYKDENEYMNAHFRREYAPVFKELENIKGNMLILFDRLEFGKGLYDYAKETMFRGSDIFYIDGQTNVSDREFVRDKCEKDGNNVIFAQAATMSTGTNIRRLDNLVMMFRSKSTVRVIQSIGRVLRLHENKQKATVIDIKFNMKYSQKHFTERIQLYRRFYNSSPKLIATLRIPKETAPVQKKEEDPV